MPSWDARARQDLLGAAMVLAASCLFAVNGTVSKLVLIDGLSSLRLVEIRCVAAAAVLVAFALWRSPGALRVTWQELRFLAVYGVVGLALVQWLYLVAITRMPVSISLLIEFTAPLLVALWVRFVRREPVRRRVWLALVAVLLGLALVAQVWAGLTLDGLALVACVLSAGCLAAYYLLGEHGLSAREPLSLATWSFVVAGVFWSVLLPWWTFPFADLTAPADLAAATDGRVEAAVPVWLLVSFVVLLGTVAPFALVLQGLSRIGATRAGLLGTAEPPLAGLVAWIVLGEALAPVQMLGGGVVLAGIVLAETARAAPQPRSVAIPEGVAPT
jgi:drug/metabolite transporter (DMT)-like permease